jgi:hypothetical protein
MGLTLRVLWLLLGGKALTRTALFVPAAVKKQTICFDFLSAGGGQTPCLCDLIPL